MKPLLILIWLPYIFVWKSSSQTAEYFHLDFPDKVVSGSLYDSIQFIDSRDDKRCLGFVYAKKGVKKLLVYPESSFNEQFNNLLKSRIDSRSKHSVLVVQLNKFEFIEIMRHGFDYSYCTLRLNLYAKTGVSFRSITTLNSTLFQESINKNLLFKTTSDTITSFILNNLVLVPKNNKDYTYSDILSIDSVEKLGTKLYTVAKYTDGVYTTFFSFKNQQPDYPVAAVYFRNDAIDRVYYKIGRAHV